MHDSNAHQSITSDVVARRSSKQSPNTPMSQRNHQSPETGWRNTVSGTRFIPEYRQTTNQAEDQNASKTTPTPSRSARVERGLPLRGRVNRTNRNTRRSVNTITLSPRRTRAATAWTRESDQPEHA